MTREEAIEILSDKVKPCLSGTDWNDAIDMAIKALEQEPSTKNDLGVDCISRAQTQTEIEMNASRYTIAKERGGMGQVEWSDQLIKVSDAVDIIRHLPSVTPQEPTDKNFTKADIDAIVKAINAGWELRVNEILDKIRAEIEQHRYGLVNDGLDIALNIIDKYKAESEGQKMDNEEKYVISEWGCLAGVLNEYGIDVSHITGRVGAHIVEDFMAAMCEAGYVSKKEAEDGKAD